MICPFLKETITTKTKEIESVKETFCKCYETECSYYVPHYTWGGGFETFEFCRRTIEKRKDENALGR